MTCLDEDYFGVSKECCFLLEHYTQHIDLGAFDQEFDYVWRLLAFMMV